MMSSIYTYIPIELFVIVIDVFCFIRVFFSKKNLPFGKTHKAFKIVLRLFAFLSFAASVLSIFLLETVLV
jgi:hypothetical protein